VLTAGRSAITEAAGHAEKMSTALTEWFGVPRPELAGPSQEDVYLAAVDHLYDCASPEEAVILLEALTGNDAGVISARTMTGARARLGRARYGEHDYQEAEALLRPSLAESSSAGPSQWSTEALSRFFLGSTLVRVDRFDEAREILQPLVDSGDQDYLASALLLLGLMGRVEFGQLFADNKLPEARDRLTKAAEALRQAKAEALRTSDEDVLLEATQELERLNSLLRPMQQRSELAAPPGRKDPQPGDQAMRAIQADAITPQAARAISPPANSPAETQTADARPAGTETSATPRPGSASLPASVLTILAEIAGAEGDSAEAESWFDRAEALADPDGELAERIKLGRATVWLDEGHTAQALAMLDQIVHGRGRWSAAAADLISAQG
jgi:tetratricopeptide (TPR) repeat protein